MLSGPVSPACRELQLDHCDADLQMSLLEGMKWPQEGPTACWSEAGAEAV
jgi:hypothetical protein